MKYFNLGITSGIVKTLSGILILFTTTVSSAQVNTWQSLGTPPLGPIRNVAKIGTNLFLATGGGGVYFSPDSGATWTQRNGAFAGMDAKSFATNGSDLFVGTSGGGPLADKIFKSSDLGITWTNITPPNVAYLSPINSILVVGTNIYIATNGSGIYKSPLAAISPTTWATDTVGLPGPVILSLAISGSNIYAGTYGQGVWASPLAGGTWTQCSTGLGNNYIESLAADGSVLFAGGMPGDSVLYKSINSGASWNQVSPILSTDEVRAININGSNIYAGTQSAGVLLSTDNGNTWGGINSGLTCQSISYFLQSGNDLYATTGCGLWKTQITPCSANVNFTLQKDSLALPAIVWDIIPNYPGNIIAANWSWGDGSNTIGLYPSHTYSAAGVYSICVTVTTACSATAMACTNSNIYKSSESNTISQVKVINNLPTSIKNNMGEKLGLNLFPNPNNGEFILEASNSNTKYFEINIVNIMGQVIYSSKEEVADNSLSKKINLKNISNGTYFVKINTEKGSITKKLILNN